MKYQFIPTRMAVIKKTSVGDYMEKLEPSNTAPVSANWSSHCGREVGSSPKLNIKLACDPLIPSLGIYSRNEKTYIHG